MVELGEIAPGKWMAGFQMYPLNEGFKERSIILVALTVSSAAFCLLALVIYRLHFHPLSKYPGPSLGRTTDWYSVYHCYIGDRHLDFHRLHCRYGDVVRYGPNRISVNSHIGLREIYGAKANVQKSKFYGVFVHFFKVPMSVSTIDRKEHAIKRRIDIHAITGTAVKSMESLVLKHVRTLCSYLVDEDKANVGDWSSARDVSDWIAYVASDIMGDMTFNRNWNVMESEEHRGVLEILAEGVAGLNLCGHMPAILKLKVDKLLFSRVTKAAESYQALSRAQAEWRIALKDNTKTRDLFSYLLEAKDPESGQSLSQEHLISEAGVLMVAGSDTMATAMAATLFYCVHYPLALQELQEEIRSTFKDIEDVKISDELNRCRYLRACIDESMRLSPSVGGVLPREVLSGGLQIGDDYFPEGTDIGVSSYALHHNEAYYPDPYLFKPERWLADQPGKTGHTSEENVAVAKSAFCPFSVGRASCVGKGLAYQEMSVILARIVWLYDMRLQAGSVRGQGHPHLGRSRDREKEFQMWDGFVSTHKGPLVEFKPRVQVTI